MKRLFSLALAMGLMVGCEQSVTAPQGSGPTITPAAAADAAADANRDAKDIADAAAAAKKAAGDAATATGDAAKAAGDAAAEAVKPNP